MKTLSEPLFELNQESKHYKNIKEVKDSQPRINEIFKDVADKLGFDPSELSFYGSRGFGFEENTSGYDKFKDQLTKQPDSNGIHKFKKVSPSYKVASPILAEIDELTSKKDPFALHDIFGINNAKMSQWIGDRFFVEVKSAEATRRSVNESNRNYEIEPVKEVSYKEYLTLVMEVLDKENV